MSGLEVCILVGSSLHKGSGFRVEHIGGFERKSSEGFGELRLEVD